MKWKRHWRELEAELDGHRRMAAADGDHVASRAMPDAVREDTRDQWAGIWLEDLARDLGYGARGLRRSPGFALVAVVTLGLGIGAATLMFSLVSGVLLRPLGFPQAAQLLATSNYLPEGAMAFLRGASRTAEWAGEGDNRDFTFTGDGPPAMLVGSPVSANFMSVLGARAALGRTFAVGEDLPGRDREVILSQRLWRERFHADPKVVGRSITLAGIDRRIVGVMPSGFGLPSLQTELWTPLRLDSADVGDYWGGNYLQLIGRMRSGATLASARAELQMLRPRLLARFGWPMPADSFAGITLTPLQAAIVGDVNTKLWLLLGGVGLLLLIACINVASLLLARGAARGPEMALRAALGASRGRVFRQLLSESLLLAGLGGAVGIGLAFLGLPVLKHVLPANLPRLAEVTLTPGVLAASMGLALFTGLGFGLAPVWQRARPGGRRGRLGDGLVVGEVAIAVMLAIAAGLTLRSLSRLAAVNPGFEVEHALTARITPNATLCASIQRCQAFYDQLLEQLRALPGVTAAGAVNGLPLEGGGDIYPLLEIDARPLAKDAEPPLAWGKIITPGYLDAMHIPLLRGRRFTAADSVAAALGVVLVSQATAQRWWPGREAVGEHFKAGAGWRTVVGVVGNVREDSLAADTAPWLSGVVYSPYGAEVIRPDNSGRPPAAMTVVMRLSGGHIPSASELGAMVERLQPDAAVSQVRMLQTSVESALAAPRSTSILFSLFAGLGLILGLIGLYGLLNYAVARRTREIGIRMALGARRATVLREVARDGVRLALAGIAAGLGGAWLLAHLMASLLYGITPTDPRTYGGVAGLWAITALLASALPARRATRIDPVAALRQE